MPTAAKVILTALAALAGPGRGTGILQGMQQSDLSAQQRAVQENTRLQQDYQRQHLAFQDEQRAYQQQQEQRAARLKQMLDSFQTELASTPDDTSAENLYTAAGQAFQSMGFRGFDVDSLKRKYKSPSMVDRAAKVFNKWSDNPQIKERLKSDPESLRDFTIGDVGGVPMTFGQYAELAHYAMLPPQPKEPPKSPTVGSFEDYVTRTYGDAPTPAQILDARKAYNQADDRAPRVTVNAPSDVSPTAKFGMEERLAKTWTDASKASREVERQFQIMQTGLQRYDKDPNGASQAVLVTFQKILDPTSVVRESEYARTAAGQSFINRLDGFAERLSRGGSGMTRSELEAMVGTAREFMNDMKAFTDGARRRINTQAQQYGLNPSAIFDDVLLGNNDKTPKRRKVYDATGKLIREE